MSSQPVTITLHDIDDSNAKKAQATRGTARGSRRAKTTEVVEDKPEVDLSKRTIKDYIELIETVARVEYSRLPNHLIDYSELVNIGAIALHTLFTNNPERPYNVTYLSTAMKWAIRNELRYRYKWYALKTNSDKSEEDDLSATGSGGLDDDETTTKHSIRETVYEAVLSVDGMMEAENPHELRDGAFTPEENSELKELGVIIKDAINRLPEREKLIIEARFYKNLKMREIGDMFNISPSRISRIVQSGLDKIKVDLTRKGYAY